MTDRSPQLQKMLDKFAEKYAIKPDERAILDTGSSHDFDCRCETCRKWWKALGPEEDEEGNKSYGPFTKEEVEAPEV